MSITERKRMVIDAIRKLQDRLCALAYNEYDGAMSRMECDAEIDALQQHLRTAHTVLVLITEEELRVAV